MFLTPGSIGQMAYFFHYIVFHPFDGRTRASRLFTVPIGTFSVWEASV